MRTAGGFAHVTYARIDKPTIDRTYFYLVYGTRHPKGLVEFRKVEKGFANEQGRVRLTAKQNSRIERTGQSEFSFLSDNQCPIPSFEEERAIQLKAAAGRMRSILEKKTKTSYEDVLIPLLEMPLVWESDIQSMLMKLKSDGEIDISGMGPRERTPKPGHVLIRPSYFHDHGHEWHFYPETKHRFYWERFPMPVLIMLHSPQDKITYWVDARQVLRNPETSALKYIAVPKRNRLRETTRDQLFSSTGAASHPILSVERLLTHLVLSRTSNASFPLSYLDLFANGLTNIARSLYFSMDLVTTIAEFHFETDLNKSTPELVGVIGMGWGHDEYEFLFNYIQFIVQQHIADVDFSDCLIDWYEREMVPRFIAPLTSRGRELVRLISELQDSFSDQLPAPPGIRVAQEDFVQMAFTPSHYLRIPLIRRFQQLVASKIV